MIKKVRDSFNRQDFMAFLGAELVASEEGMCEIRIPYNRSLTQQHGYFHAGVIGTIADNAAGYAAYSLMDEDSSVLTVEYKLNLLSPAEGDYLLCRSNVIKRGRTLSVCRSEVFGVTAKSEKLCAIAQVTLIELTNTADNEKKGNS